MQSWRWEYSLLAAAMLVAGMLLIAGLRTDRPAVEKSSGGRHAHSRITVLAAMAA